MKIKLLFFAMCFYSMVTWAQKAADASLILDSQITDINLHQSSGIAIATTHGGVYGVDDAGQKVWEFKEAGLITALNSLGQEGGTSFSEIPMSSLGRVGQSIFNIKNGQKILDSQSNGYQKIIDNKYINGKKAILFFTKTDSKKGKLFLVTIENNNIVWESEIETKKKLESLFGDLGGFNHFSQSESHIAFSAAKTVFVINKNDGQVLTSEKYDVGKLFFTEDGKKLIAVEAKGGSMIGSALKAGFTMGLSLLSKDPIGKEMIAFDTQTGKEAWKKPIKLDEGFVDYKFINGNLFAIHEDGANLYDTQTGKEVWKREFKKSKVKNIEKTDEGYMVYYKNKRHLVANDGKKIWKRAEKVIDNVDFEVEDEEEFTTFTYNKGTIIVTPYRIEYFAKGDDKRVYKIKLNDENDKLAFDEKNKNLVLISKKKLYILNPDKGLGKDEVKKIDFKESDQINQIEIRDQGYFINGNWEYAIVDFKGNVIKKAYFAQPGEGLRLLKNVGANLAAIGTATVTVQDTSNEQRMNSSTDFVNKKNAEASQTYYVSKHHKEFEGLNNYLYTPERFSAFQETKNSTFFYTKKDGKKVLLQINKDSGDIVDSFEFGENNPYYVIDKAIKQIYYANKDTLEIFSYK